MRPAIRGLGITIAFLAVSVCLRAQEEKVDLDKVPAPAVQAVKKRFPEGKISAASKETENGKVAYEITLKDKGLQVEVTVTPEGTLLTIEREIHAKNLPKAVKAAFDAKHANAKVELIEEVIKVEDGKETLQYYEFHLPGDAEVLVNPDGKIREASPAPKK
jgi:hypothetical protein